MSLIKTILSKDTKNNSNKFEWKIGGLYKSGDFSCYRVFLFSNVDKMIDMIQCQRFRDINPKTKTLDNNSLFVALGTVTITTELYGVLAQKYTIVKILYKNKIGYMYYQTNTEIKPIFLN